MPRGGRSSSCTTPGIDRRARICSIAPRRAGTAGMARCSEGSKGSSWRPGSCSPCARKRIRSAPPQASESRSKCGLGGCSPPPTSRPPSTGSSPGSVLPAELVALAVSAGFPAREREAFPEAEPGSATALASWLVGAARTEPAARRYLFFLKSLYETFHAIEECFPRSSGGPGGVGTSPEEMLHVANHLYLLASGGVPGLLLECGCYKGFSSACLSHACAFLGRDLVVADSFAGLPPGGFGEEGYRPGDFRGRRDEVEANVR